MLQETHDLDEILDRVKRGTGLTPVLSNREAERLVKDKIIPQKIRIVPFYDDDYPEPLKTLYDPPPILYIKGEYRPQDQVALGVVGTRRYTDYGRRVSADLVVQLVARGVTVISGMALGIDAFAHRAALDAGGRTIAVLGSGVDVIAPIQNSKIYHRMVESGAVVSEFLPGIEGGKHTFPQRNRIISGLSLGVLVVEAGETSGALITADFAVEQGREVFAIPGEISSHASVGTNKLIQTGAKLVASVEDILDELPQLGRVDINSPDGSAMVKLSDPTEQVVCDLLTEHKSLNTDEILSSTVLDAGSVLTAISSLELRGLIKRASGDVFGIV